MTWSIPTSSAICRATAPLSPVSKHRGEPEALELCNDGLGAGGLDGVDDHEHAAGLAVAAPADRDDGLAFAFCLCLGGDLEAQGRARSAISDSLPTSTACPSTTPCTLMPSTFDNSGAVGGAPVS